MDLRSHRGAVSAGRVPSVLLQAVLALAIVACDATVEPSSKPSPTAAEPSAPSVRSAASASSAAAPSAAALTLPAPTSVWSPVPQPSSSPAPSPRAEASAASPTAAPAAVGPSPCPGTETADLTGSADRSSSTNWSGVAAISSRAAIGCVEATWVQPSVRCSARSVQAVSIWVGIGGFDQRALEQIGTEVDCRRGKATSSMWHESLPRQRYEVQLGLTIRSGDHIRARVLALGGSRYELSIANLTRHTSFTVRDTNRGLRPTSAEWIVEAPTGGCPSSCHILPLPDFGKFRFSGAWATVAGARQPMTGAGTTHVLIAIEDEDGAIRASAGSMARAGTSFVVTWRRS